MSKGDAKAPSQRQLRVGEELRHALAWILERGDIRDPGLAGVAVTVTEVRVSPDLRNATAFVMPLGGDHVPSVVEALNRAAPFVRRQLGKAVKLRRLPALDFVADTSFDEAGRIANYRLRIPDAKTKAVSALKGLNLKVIAAGDSYNDTGMLKEADVGILFRAPENVVKKFPQFPVTRTYEEFKTAIIEANKQLEGNII